MKNLIFANAQTLVNDFFVSAFGSLAFGIIGIILLLLGYFTFEFVTRRLNINDELQKGNMAVGVVVAGLLLGIAIIVASVVQ